MTRWNFGLVVVCVGLLTAATGLRAADEAVRIAKWKDDKKAAFALMFDDSMTVHIKNALPELKKRNLVGTFYVNPGSGQFKAYKGAWEKDIPAAGGVLANHTFTHKGAKTPENLEEEITLANDAIRAIDPKATLISFGIPGVKQGDWAVTKEQLAEALKKHKLLLRPETGGHWGHINFKTGAELISRIDKGLATGSFDFCAFHGIGGEWLSTDLPPFIELLDALVAKREQLWITDTISAQKYETERATAKATIEKSGAELRVTVKCDADAALYNQPLTVIAKVPADWKKCQAIQGSTKTDVAVTNGAAMFDAVPNGEPVVLKP